MKIRKTVVQITILHPADETVESVPLDEIAYQIDEGGWLGHSEVVSVAELDDASVPNECRKLGNDGDRLTNFEKFVNAPIEI